MVYLTYTDWPVASRYNAFFEDSKLITHVTRIMINSKEPEATFNPELIVAPNMQRQLELTRSWLSNFYTL